MAKIRKGYVSNSSSSSFIISDKKYWENVVKIAKNVIANFVETEEISRKDVNFDTLFNKFLTNQDKNIKDILEIKIYENAYGLFEYLKDIRTMEINDEGCIFCEYFINKECKYCESCKSTECNQKNKIPIRCCAFGFIYRNYKFAKEPEYIISDRFQNWLRSEYFPEMHEIYVEKVDKLNMKYIREISFNNMNKKKFKSYENKVKKWIENEINRIYNERMECLTFSSEMGDANEMYIRSYGILNEIEKNCKEQKINCYIVDNS